MTHARALRSLQAPHPTLLLPCSANWVKSQARMSGTSNQETFRADCPGRLVIDVLRQVLGSYNFRHNFTRLVELMGGGWGVGGACWGLAEVSAQLSAPTWLAELRSWGLAEIPPLG
jgi:hypothetical protein